MPSQPAFGRNSKRVNLATRSAAKGADSGN
jgi:hypothetical protein